MLDVLCDVLCDSEPACQSISKTGALSIFLTMSIDTAFLPPCSHHRHTFWG